jgi:hypothetical protein
MECTSLFLVGVLGRGGYPTNEVILLRPALSANRKGVEQSQRQCVLNRLILPLRRSPWPRIFIPIIPLPDAFICLMTLTTVAGSASM